MENFNYDLITFEDQRQFQPVDAWIPEPQDEIFKTAKGIISCNISSYFNMPPNAQFDAFVLNAKRAYNNPDMREHTVHYLNYFEKFYDKDHELPLIYAKLKYLIDFVPQYNTESFLYDLTKYIMKGPISLMLDFMNRDNYSLNLSYKNQRNPSLQYSDKHGKIMMKMSVMMNCIIPLVCHFMYIKNITNSTDFLLKVYDILINDLYDIDLYNKLFETVISTINRSAKRNQTMWNMQDIRGIDTTIHSLQSVQNILINLMPKYRYDGNLIHLNYKSIMKNNGFQVLDIEYEYDFINLSSSKRDEDMNSEFDKFESFLAKTDEGLLVQNMVACDDAMNQIRIMYGPFDDEEIKFYRHRLSDGGKCTVNSFQKDLVFNLFFKYFGDTNTINAINLNDYITLIIAARRILEASRMVMLPYIISSRVIRLANRKNINKKEFIKLENSPLWKEIKNKYRNNKIEKHILSIIAAILSSEFEIIDPSDKELNGQQIQIIPELVCEELLIYISLI